MATNEQYDNTSENPYYWCSEKIASTLDDLAELVAAGLPVDMIRYRQMQTILRNRDARATIAARKAAGDFGEYPS